MTFEPSISLGNIITVAVLVLGFVATFVRLGERLRTLELWKLEQAAITRQQVDILEEVRRSFAYLRGQLGRRTNWPDVKNGTQGD